MQMCHEGCQSVKENLLPVSDAQDKQLLGMNNSTGRRKWNLAVWRPQKFHPVVELCTWTQQWCPLSYVLSPAMMDRETYSIIFILIFWPGNIYWTLASKEREPIWAVMSDKVYVAVRQTKIKHRLYGKTVWFLYPKQPPPPPLWGDPEVILSQVRTKRWQSAPLLWH